MRRESALELGRKIKNREITVREAVTETLQRIEKSDQQIGSYITLSTDLEEQIKTVQEGIDKGHYQSPLAGVPAAVKDNICTKGLRTTCGSKMLADFVPSYDAEAVRRLKAAGGIVLGKTNLDEFAMGSTTESSYYGITRNPWDLKRVPGGSSGGSAAAVAAGLAAYSLGSDTGGSIRQPASMCGITGIKPTYGRVSRYGLVAYGSSLDQIGPMAIDVSDCTAVLEMIASYDEKDSTSVRADTTFTTGLTEGIKGMRIGIPRQYLEEGLDEKVRGPLLEVAQKLVDAGAEVEYFSLDLIDYMVPTYYTITSAEVSSNLARFDGVKYGFRAETNQLREMYRQTRSEGFGSGVKKRLMLGSLLLSSEYYDAYYLQALKVRRMIQQVFAQAFQKYDVIMGPTVPGATPMIGASLKDPLKMYAEDIYTVAANLVGFPAISVPCGRLDDGLPMGVQFMADCLNEKEMIRVAYNYEQLRGPWELPVMTGGTEQ